MVLKKTAVVDVCFSDFIIIKLISVHFYPLIAVTSPRETSLSLYSRKMEFLEVYPLLLEGSAVEVNLMNPAE